MNIDYTRHLTLSGEISIEGASALIAEVRKLELDSPDPIYLTMCSNGGSTSAALWVCDYFRCMPNKIVMIAAGTVQSAALTIFAAADRRYSYPSTVFFAHSTMFVAECNNPDELQAVVRDYMLTNEKATAMEASGTNLTYEQWTDICVKNHTFDAEQALSLGLIHGIIPWRDKA